MEQDLGILFGLYYKVLEQRNTVVKICNTILGMIKTSFSYTSQNMIVTRLWLDLICNIVFKHGCLI